MAAPTGSLVAQLAPDTTTPGTVTYNAVSGKGYALFISCTASNGVIDSVTDDAGNTWALVVSADDPATGRADSAWVCVLDAGLFTSITINWTVNPTASRQAGLVEVTGANTASNAAFAVAFSGDTRGNSVAPAGFAITPGVLDTLLLASIQWNNNNHSTQVNAPTDGTNTYTKFAMPSTGPAIAWTAPAAATAVTPAWTLTGGAGAGSGQVNIAIAPGSATQTLVGGSIATAEAFGAGTVTPGPVTLVGGSIASAEAFGAGFVVPGGLVLTSTGGIPTAEAFGAGAVIPDQALVSGGGIASAEAFGTGSLVSPAVLAGPIVGNVTDDAITVSWKLSGVSVATDVRLSADDGGGAVFSSIVNPDANGWVKATVSGLTVDTSYALALEVDGAIVGTGAGGAVTDPTPGAPASFSIAFGSCNQTAVSGPSFSAMSARVGAFGERARRLIHMGDMWYSAYTTAPQVEAAYANFFGDTDVRPNLDDLPIDYTVDNNDWGGADSDKNFAGAGVLTAGYRAYMPHYPLSAADGVGLWHSFVIGRVRFIVLDTRSQRDPRTDPDGPSKDLLGSAQRTWFEAELQQAEQIKIICSSIPWRALGGINGDRWQSYLTEWDTVNDLIDTYASGRVYAIFGDRHALCADDGTAADGRGVPQAGGAPFNQGSVALPVGEVWSQGYWAGPGGTAQPVTLYGWLDIDDRGDEIEIAYDGRSANDDTTRVSMTTLFDLEQTLDGAGHEIASAEAMGAGTVTPGTTTLLGASIATAEAFGPGVLVPDQLLVGGSIASAEAMGPGLVSLAGGPQTLVGLSIASAEAFGPGVVAPGPVILAAPGSIASAEALGAGSLAVGTVTLLGVSIASAEAFDDGLVFAPGTATIITSPGGIQSAEAFGPGLVAMMGTTMQTAPCSWNVDTSCATDWLSFSDAVRERAALWATEILWALSGRQFGACAVTVRPCTTCNPTSYEEWGVWMDGYGGFGGEATYFPYVWNGSWRNCGCAGMCACGVTQEVWLPGPVAGIVEVKVNGVAVASDSYRVDDATFLVNESATLWPEQQSMDAPAGAADTFTVTYLRGVPPPRSGEIAAGALAWEFAKACTGGACRLPGSVQSIVRQGVEMTLVADDAAEWLTGIHEADQFLKAFNPGRLKSRPRVHTLDLPGPRQTTWGF